MVMKAPILATPVLVGRHKGQGLFNILGDIYILRFLVGGLLVVVIFFFSILAKETGGVVFLPHYGGLNSMFNDLSGEQLKDSFILMYVSYSNCYFYFYLHK